MLMKGDRFIEENNTTTFPWDFFSTRDRCTQINEFCFIFFFFFLHLGLSEKLQSVAKNKDCTNKSLLLKRSKTFPLSVAREYIRLVRQFNIPTAVVKDKQFFP